MTHGGTDSGARGPAHRSLELAVAGFTSLAALVTIFGSLKVGIGWAVEGPKAGFFPFCIGLILLGGSLVNLVRAFVSHHHRIFAEWEQIRQVVAVAVPTGLYVISIGGISPVFGIGFPAGWLSDSPMLVPGIGIYVSSAILIGWFMKSLGGYRWPATLAISIALPAIIYFMFERWFVVSLPKGPLETLLGL